jgi:hypothetical protein
MMITPFAKNIDTAPDVKVKMSWVGEDNKRAAFVRLVGALSAARDHICRNGCGRVGDNHCTSCQGLEAVLIEAMGVLEAWDE